MNNSETLNMRMRCNHFSKQVSVNSYQNLVIVRVIVLIQEKNITITFKCNLFELHAVICYSEWKICFNLYVHMLY